MVRGDDSVEVLLATADAAIVMSNDGAMSIATGNGVLKAHLGTAFIRLKSLDRGDGDPLIRAGEIVTGDHVIDTTFGLGRDAVVAACAVGPQGSVTALESSRPLYYLGRHGVTTGPLSPAALTVLGDNLKSTQIRITHGDAVRWLSNAEDGSADIVLVDPMFETPKTSDTGFELLRSLAADTGLTKEWIEQACRVARRWVVIKTGSAPDWFESMGAERVHSHSNATWWRIRGSGQGRS